MSEHNPGLAASPDDWPKALFYVAPLFSIFQILRAVHVGFLVLVVFLCFPVRGQLASAC